MGKLLLIHHKMKNKDIFKIPRFAALRKKLLQKEIITKTVFSTSEEEIKNANFILFLNHLNDTFAKICFRLNKTGLFILVLVESPLFKQNYNTKNHQKFDKLFTWCDDLVDNKKSFKFLIPYFSKEVKSYLKTIHYFKDKKLITLISSDLCSFDSKELYSERRIAARFFEKQCPNDFDLYGFNWHKFKLAGIKQLKYNLKDINYKRIKLFIQTISGFPKFKSYQGETSDKLETLSKYKFAICYENARAPNYITEKIFDCFKAKCVPIYLGAQNISELIPTNTFINKEEYSYAELLEYIQTISEEEYNKYLRNIEKFLQSEELLKWTYEYFADDIIEKLGL